MRKREHFGKSKAASMAKSVLGPEAGHTKSTPPLCKLGSQGLRSRTLAWAKPKPPVSLEEDPSKAVSRALSQGALEPHSVGPSFSKSSEDSWEG